MFHTRHGCGHRHAHKHFGFFGMHHHHGPGRHGCGGEEDSFSGGGGFGIRRPLRFLSHKLALDEKQMAELARILDVLKTERAQAEVDRRRMIAGLADALAADSFDLAKVQAAGGLRVKSAESLSNAVTTALQQIHAILTAEQRAKLAYLVRAGTVQF